MTETKEIGSEKPRIKGFGTSEKPYSPGHPNAIPERIFERMMGSERFLRKILEENVYFKMTEGQGFYLARDPRYSDMCVLDVFPINENPPYEQWVYMNKAMSLFGPAATRLMHKGK